MSFAAKAVTGGLMAILGLMFAKFLFGLFGAAFAFLMFFLVKVVPIILLGLVVAWLFRKLTRKESAA
jgi:hypothetical protein